MEAFVMEAPVMASVRELTLTILVTSAYRNLDIRGFLMKFVCRMANALNVRIWLVVVTQLVRLEQLAPLVLVVLVVLVVLRWYHWPLVQYLSKVRIENRHNPTQQHEC